MSFHLTSRLPSHKRNLFLLQVYYFIFTSHSIFFKLLKPSIWCWNSICGGHGTENGAGLVEQKRKRNKEMGQNHSVARCFHTSWLLPGNKSPDFCEDLPAAIQCEHMCISLGNLNWPVDKPKKRRVPEHVFLQNGERTGDTERLSFSKPLCPDLKEKPFFLYSLIYS